MVMVHFYMKYVGNASPSNVGKVSLRGPEKPGLLWSKRAGGWGHLGRVPLKDGDGPKATVGKWGFVDQVEIGRKLARKWRLGLVWQIKKIQSDLHEN